MHIQKKLSVFFLMLGLFFLLPQAGMSQEVPPISGISGVVWLEKTVDGLYRDEGGLEGVKLILEQRHSDGAVSVIASCTTLRNGQYAFSVPGAGEYRVKAELPKGYQFTRHGLDSSALPAQGSQSATPFFSWTEGEAAQINMGTTKTHSYLSFIAFEDENANGGRMQSEPLIRDVRIELLYEYDGQTYLIASAQTDRSGETSIRTLSPGTYRVRVTLPGSYVSGPLGQKINLFYNCVLPIEDNVGLSAPFNLESKGSLGLGIGAVRTGTLNGKIWFDENYNGTWDKEETGLTGASVLLHSDALNLTREASPDESGHYAFTALQPGAYRLEVRLPEGMIFTHAGQSLLSDIASAASLNVSVQVDTNTGVGPIGAMPSAALGVSFYLDQNRNGQWDAGEPAVPGATVTAVQNGKQVDAQVSNEQGSLRFAVLRGGDAQLQCTLPAGYVFLPQEGGLFAVENAVFEATASVFVQGTAGQYTVPLTNPAAITGQLFEDSSNTGIFQAGFPLLSGFTVQAMNENGAVSAQTQTDANGSYTLSPLLPGTYTVHFLLNDPYVATPYAVGQGVTVNHILTQTPEYGETEAVTLLPGGEFSAMDAGVFRAGVIDGQVLLPDGQGGLAGVTVTLLDEYGAPFSDYTYGQTDPSGYFIIKGALPGTYSLQYVLPADSAFTAPLTDVPEYESDSFVIGSGTEMHMPPLEGLYTATLSGWIVGADPATPVYLTLSSLETGALYETQSMEDGQYILSGLRPGNYELNVALPDGYIFGDLEGSPVPGVLAQTTTVPISFAMGECRSEANIAAVHPAAFSGTVFYDADQSATQDADEYGAEARSLTLMRKGQVLAEITTDESGAFYVESLIPGECQVVVSLESNEVLVGHNANEEGEWVIPVDLLDAALFSQTELTVPVMTYGSVSGQVWSMDGTMNSVASIPVELLDQSGEAVGRAVTDQTGAFAFDTLVPGEYTLSATLPNGFLFAREQDALDRESCIISREDGSSEAISFFLEIGDEISGKDIGIGAMGAIGDRAWLDENGNGMQDIGEPDMPGILVELYQHGQLIASATTDVYGHYSLTGLYPGEYQMQVTMHPELKATLHQTDFPLVGSVLPESKETTVTAEGIIVPSGGRTLHYDLGFQLRKKDVYPDAMNTIPTKDWRPYTDR